MIEAALAESNGKVSGPAGAAAKLGIPQSTLDSKIKSLKIYKRQFRKVESILIPDTITALEPSIVELGCERA